MPKDSVRDKTIGFTFFAAMAAAEVDALYGVTGIASYLVYVALLTSIVFGGKYVP
jgi:hypothetical protein